MAARKPDGRTRVTRDLALRSAIHLADTHGLDAVSMRALAAGLGVVPMALYKHVTNKDDLLTGMVDTLLDELLPLGNPLRIGDSLPRASVEEDEDRPKDEDGPSHSTDEDEERDEPSVGAEPRTDPHGAATDWRHAVSERIHAARALVLEHAWLPRVIETRTRRTEAVLRHMDSLVSAMLAGGLSPELAHHGMHALGHRIWGFNPEAFDGPDALPLPSEPDARSAEVGRLTAAFPGIAAIAGAATDGDGARLDSGCDEEAEFAFGLDLLLDGIARRAATDST